MRTITKLWIMGTLIVTMNAFAEIDVLTTLAELDKLGFGIAVLTLSLFLIDIATSLKWKEYGKEE